MKETALVIMAAGMGTRYGSGIKQLARVGPSGEAIIDYSIHDAIEAGFSKVIFIIRRDIEDDFREIVGNHIEKIARVEYVYQELTDLPAGYLAPPGRTKPWGTGQAIWAARNAADCPFAVINADDFYGAEPYRMMHAFLTEEMSDDESVFDYCMAGYRLGNTLSSSGTVSRGICVRDEHMYLSSVTETYHIGYRDGILKGDDIHGHERELDVNALVSMNMWGLKPNVMGELEEKFRTFLDCAGGGDLKSEFLLPFVVDELIQSKKATVRVLPVHEKWYGVTYIEDKQFVTEAISGMVSQGVYTEKLFG